MKKKKKKNLHEGFIAPSLAINPYTNVPLKALHLGIQLSSFVSPSYSCHLQAWREVRKISNKDFLLRF
jgi:hypothetical protein